MKSFKVIGIHIGKHKANNFNCGIILRNPIKEFYNNYNIFKKEKSFISISTNDEENRNIKPIEYYDNAKNEISLKLKVDYKDINKKVYFLDNTNFISWHTKQKHYHDYLKELNESNTRVFINNEEKIFKKYFIPKEEGIYDIKIVFDKKLKDINFMSSNCDNILSVDLSCLDTSNLTEMRSMFYECYQLKSIDFTNFFTKNVVNMKYLFVRCKKLEEIDISSFDMNKAKKDMNDFLLDCHSLRKVKVKKEYMDIIKEKLGKLKSKVNLIGI